MLKDKIDKKYQELKNEIETFVEDFRTDEYTRRMVDKYWKGIKVLFSPLIYIKLCLLGLILELDFFLGKNNL